MKILHVCLCGPFNDNWNYQENALVSQHKKMGFNVAVITTVHINDIKSSGYLDVAAGKYLSKEGVPIQRLQYTKRIPRFIASILRCYSGTYAAIDEYSPDIIFCHGLQFLDLLSVCRYMKRHPRAKLFIDCHEDLNNSAKTILSKYILHKVLWRALAQISLKYTEVYWGTTPARMEFLVKMYDIPRSKTDLLFFGAEDSYVSLWSKDAARVSLGVSSEDFIFVSGGKIDRNKTQVLKFMRAFRKINSSVAKLIIFGSVSNELEDEFSRNLNDRIRYIGWVEPKDTYRVFAAADMIVFPGLHSVFWEQAVGMGIPCIFKSIDGFRHVDIGGNCIFIEKDDEKYYMDLINDILHDNNKYVAMCKSSLGPKREDFLYSKIAMKSIHYE